MSEWVGIFLAIGAVWAYFTGYCYLSFYYSFFKISVGELNFGFQEIVVHAFPAIIIFYEGNHQLILFEIFILCSSVLILYSIGSLEIIHGRVSYYISSMIFFLALFVSSYKIAEYSGYHQAQIESHTLPVLNIVFKDKVETPLDRAKIPDQMRHVITTNSAIFAIVFSPVDAGFWSVRIPLDEIAMSTRYKD